MYKGLICKGSLAAVLFCLASGNFSGLYAQNSRPISTPDKRVSRELWDVWRQGFDYYEDGEMKMIAGKYEEALPLYQKSLEAFESVRKQNPKWNRSVITYRINLSGRRIATVKRKLEESGRTVKASAPETISTDKTIVAKYKAQEQAAETARVNVVLKQQISKLEADTRTLRQEAQKGNEALKQIKGLLAEREQMEKQIASLRLNVNKLIAEQKKLSPRTAELERQLVSEQNRSGKYAETIAKGNQEITRLKERLAELSRAKKKIDEEYTSLEHRLSSEKKVAADYQKRQMDRIETLSASLERQKETGKSLEKKLKDAGELLAEKTKSMEVMKLELQKLRAGQLPADTVQRLEKANARLSGEVAVLKKAAEDAEKVRESSAKEIAALQAERDQLKRTLASNIEQRNDYSKANDSISKQFSELSKKYSQLASIHASQTVKLEQIQKERNLFAARINEQDSEMNNHRKRIQDLQKNVTELSSGLRKAQGQNAAFLRERQTLQKQLQERDVSLQQTRKEIAEFRTRLAAASESGKRIAQLEGELSSAKQNLTGREKEIKDLNAVLQSERSKNAAAKQEAEKIAAVFSERLRNEQIKGVELSAQIASLKSKLSGTELASSSAKKLQAQLVESEKKLHARSAELQKCADELQKSSAELNASRQLLEKQKLELAELNAARLNQKNLSVELNAAKTALDAVMKQSSKDVQAFAEMKIKLADTEKRLALSEQSLKQLQSERDALKGEQLRSASEYGKKISVLQSELTSLQKQLESAQKIAKSSVPAERQSLTEQEIKRLSSEITVLKKQLESVSAEKAQAEQEARLAKTESSRSKADAARTASETVQFKAESIRLNAETTRLKEEVKKNQEESAQAKAELLRLKKQFDTLQTKAGESVQSAELQQQLAAANSKLKESQALLADQKTFHEKEHAFLLKAEARVKELNSQAQTSAEDLRKLREANTALQEESIRTSAKLKASEASVAALRKAIENITVELASSEKNSALLKAELNELRKNAAGSVQSDAALKKEIAALKGSLDFGAAELVRLKKNLAETEKELEVSRKESATSTRFLTESRKALAESVFSLDNLRKQLAVSSKRVQELDAEKKVLLEELQKFQGTADEKERIRVLQANLKKLDEAAKKTEQEKNLAENNVRRLHEQIGHAQATIRNLRRTIASQDAMIAELRPNAAKAVLSDREMKRLQGELQTVKAESTKLKNDNDREMTNLKAEIGNKAKEVFELREELMRYKQTAGKLAQEKKSLEEERGKNEKAIASLKALLATEQTKDGKDILRKRILELIEEQKKFATASDSELMKAIAAKNEALDEAFKEIRKEQELSARYHREEEKLRLQSSHQEKRVQLAEAGARNAVMEVQRARAQLTMLQQNIDDGLLAARKQKAEESPVRITVKTAVPAKSSKFYNGEMEAGRKAEAAGDNASALYHYWKAADAEPNKAEPYQALLKFHLKRKEWSDAEQAYQSALKNGAARNSETEELFKKNIKK